MRNLAILVCFAALLSSGNSHNEYREKELVTNLPNWPNSHPLYTGYLKVGPKNPQLHYLFSPSLGNPKSDPLVLWLNGGPGCSSLVGFTKEIGVNVIEDGEKDWATERNRYSWNYHASILYLEMPGGVGFSMIESPGDRRWDDKNTGEESHAALMKFYSLWPEYRSRPFFIAGESYAGTYVPFLAQEILRKNSTESIKIRLEGIIIGNGASNRQMKEDSVYDFLYRHNIYGPETREILKTVCKKDKKAARCQFAKKSIKEMMKQMNPYDIYRTCYHDESDERKSRYLYSNFYEEHLEKIGFESMLEGPHCIDSFAIEKYYNRKDVRRALHIPERFDNKKWSICTRFPKSYEKNPLGGEPIYPFLREKGVRILLFSGDTDSVVPYTWTVDFLERLNWPVTEEWRAWKYREQPSGHERLGGHLMGRGVLQFATVIGVGHMAAQWRRDATAHLFVQFINSKTI